MGFLGEVLLEGIHPRHGNSLIIISCKRILLLNQVNCEEQHPQGNITKSFSVSTTWFKENKSDLCVSTNYCSVIRVRACPFDKWGTSFLPAEISFFMLMAKAYITFLSVVITTEQRSPVGINCYVCECFGVFFVCECVSVLFFFLLFFFIMATASGEQLV